MSSSASNNALQHGSELHYESGKNSTISSGSGDVCEGPMSGEVEDAGTAILGAGSALVTPMASSSNDEDVQARSLRDNKTKVTGDNLDPTMHLNPIQTSSLKNTFIRAAEFNSSTL